MKKFIIIGAAILMFGAMTVTAYASSAYETPAEAAAALTGKTTEEVVTQKQDSDMTYGEIAADAGKLEEFKTEMLEIKKDRLDEKVADGTLTQEKADEIYKAIEEKAANCDGTGSGQIGKNYGVGFGMGNGQGNGSGNNGQGNKGNGMGNGNGNGNGTGVCVNQ